jgi:hypothetical protein
VPVLPRRPRCAACGVTLPRNAGRCPSCGHDIGRALVVEVGDGPAIGPAPGSDPRRPRHRRTAGAAVAVLATVIGALILVDARYRDPDDGKAAGAAATATTDRPRPTGTVLPPVDDPDPPATLPGSTGIRVVTLGPRIQVAELDTGEVTTVGTVGTPPFSPWAGVARGSGVVMVGSAGVLYFPDLVPEATAVSLGEGDHVLASDQADRVWIVVGYPFGDRLGFVPLAGGASSTTAREVDLTGAVTAGPIALPDGVTAIEGMPGGLLVHGPDGVFLVDRGGGARRVARGTPIDTFGANLVHFVCDPDMRCGFQVTDVTTGERRRIEGARDLPAGFYFGAAAVSPDGTLLAWDTHVEGQQPGMEVIDLTTGTVVRSDGFLSSGSVAWSSDGRWLIRASHSGGPGAASESHALDIEGGEIIELDLPPGDNGILVLASAGR